MDTELDSILAKEDEIEEALAKVERLLEKEKRQADATVAAAARPAAVPPPAPAAQPTALPVASNNNERRIADRNRKV